MSNEDVKQEIRVENNRAAERFEAHLAGYTAIAQYRMEDPSTIAFIHTEVPPELEGKGVGSALVKTALDTVRQEGLTVVPLCPFVAAYIRRHHEYLDIVAPQYQSKLQS